jgi:AcrR family transcriptional regulator
VENAEKAIYQTGPYGNVLIVLTKTKPLLPRRGRPRDPTVDRAILESARSVLARKGFTGTSMEEIARTAGVGKDTLYRRWKSKETLVQHLLAVLAAENVPVPVDDDPRYALFVFLQDIVRLNVLSDFGAIVAGIVGESARNPDMARAFRQFWSERRSIAGDIVRRIVDPATPDGEIDRILDHVLGPIYYRLLLSGSPISDEYLWDLIVEVSWPTGEQEDQIGTT